MRGGNNLGEALLTNDSGNKQSQPMSIAMRLKKNKDAMMNND